MLSCFCCHAPCVVGFLFNIINKRHFCCSKMVAHNAITGLKRRRDRRHLPRKKREQLSSTVAGQMHAAQAMEAFKIFMTGCQVQLNILAVSMVADVKLNKEERSALCALLLIGSHHCCASALEMLRVDSSLMDLMEEEIEEAGCKIELVDINMSTCVNDDECENETRFSKDTIRQILHCPPVGEHVRVHCNPNNPGMHCKFPLEALLICVLRRMSVGRTLKDLADNEFGGCSEQWGTGCDCFVKLMDLHFKPLIGPEATSIWAEEFPVFADAA